MGGNGVTSPIGAGKALTGVRQGQGIAAGVNPRLKQGEARAAKDPVMNQIQPCLYQRLFLFHCLRTVDVIEREELKMSTRSIS